MSALLQRLQALRADTADAIQRMQERLGDLDRQIAAAKAAKELPPSGIFALPRQVREAEAEGGADKGVDAATPTAPQPAAPRRSDFLQRVLGNRREEFIAAYKRGDRIQAMVRAFGLKDVNQFAYIRERAGLKPRYDKSGRPRKNAKRAA